MTEQISARGSDLLRSTMRRCGVGVAYAAFVGIFINLLQMVVPLYTIQVYDRVLSSGSFDTLIMLSMLAVFCLLFLAVLDFLRARVFMVVGDTLSYRLSQATLEAAVRTALRQPSPLAAQGLRDLQDLRHFFASGPVSLPIDAAFAPLFMIVLVLIHPVYAIVGFLALTVMIGLGLLTELLVRRPNGRASELALRSNGETVAAIRHGEVIESMGMLSAIGRRWSAGLARAQEAAGNGASTAKAIAAISRSTRSAIQISILATGVTLVLEHEVTAGSIIAAMIMMGRFLAPFEHLIEGWRQWSLAIAAFGRLKTLLASSGGDRSTTPMQADRGRLVVDGVTFVPPGAERPVLKGLRFSLEAGEVLGVVGPSGAGKSTLARLLVGLWRPTAGGIYLDGYDVFTWERCSFGQQVGYLPQSAALIDGTVRENIGRFGDADANEVVAAAKAAGVHDLIGRLPLGFETRVGDSGFSLSGGQKQRIALARALFGGPKLIVLDEPNANIDSAGEQALLDAIREAKANGRTVVIIAHRMSAMAVADKLLVMRDGMIEQFGPRADVLKSLATQTAGPSRSIDPKVATLPLERVSGA